jgi:hypothetical protein
MGGRKVCFIDMDGQVATCLRDDEDCKICPSEKIHDKNFKRNDESTDKKNELLKRIASLLNNYADTIDGQNDLLVAVSFDACCEKYIYNGEHFVKIHIK